MVGGDFELQKKREGMTRKREEEKKTERVSTWQVM